MMQDNFQTMIYRIKTRITISLGRLTAEKPLLKKRPNSVFMYINVVPVYCISFQGRSPLCSPCLM